MPLKQLEFTSQRVRNSDPAAFHFLNAGIAAMRNDVDAIDLARDQLRREFPTDAIAHGNIAKAYLGVRREDRVLDQVSYMLDDADLTVDITEMMSLLVPFGRMDEIRRYLETHQGSSDDVERKMLESLVHSVPEYGIDPADFKRIYMTCTRILRDRGWNAPANSVDAPPVHAAYGLPLVALQFGIEAEPETMLEIEDEMVSALFDEHIDAFTKGHVNVRMGYV